jgi:hypothetical protein
MYRLELKTFLDCRCTPSIRAGVAEWLSRWPRDPSLHKRGPVPKRQASQWALCSQGFESLSRRHFFLEPIELILEKSQFKAFLEGLQQLTEFDCNFLLVKNGSIILEKTKKCK